MKEDRGASRRCGWKGIGAKNTHCITVLVCFLLFCFIFLKTLWLIEKSVLWTKVYTIRGISLRIFRPIQFSFHHARTKLEMEVETRAVAHVKRLLLFRILNTFGTRRIIWVKSSHRPKLLTVVLTGGQISILILAPQGFECAYERKNNMWRNRKPAPTFIIPDATLKK
jgi:hypothetical protein